MGDGGGERVKQAFREEAFPLRVVEGKNVDAVAEFREDIASICAFTTFGHREKIDAVVGCETFEEMVGAVICAAIQRPGNVRINSEDFHQL